MYYQRTINFYYIRAFISNMSAQVLEKKNEDTLWGHPKGLYVLFMTEMWERFSYYGMRAILVTYMMATATDKIGPGFSWSGGDAYKVYGWYVMLVYVMSIIGGIIADKYWGQKKSVLIGAIILCFGHGVLAFEGIPTFFAGLALIILGVGFLKPNISTMVGGLYDRYDIRRDKAFSIFYVGINLGSLLASIIVVWIKGAYGWHAAFGAAGIAMIIGLINYLYGLRYLKSVGNFEKPDKKSEENVSVAGLFKHLMTQKLHLGITMFLVVLSLVIGFNMEAVDKVGWGALFVFVSLVSGMLMSIYTKLENRIEKDRFIVLLLSFILVIIFWGAFEQAGGLMTVYTKEKTNLDLLGFTLEPEMVQGLNAGFILLFAVAVANYWAKRNLTGKEASSLFKMVIGTIIMGLGFVFMVFAVQEFESDGQSSLIWLVLAYLFHTIGELCSSPVALSFITKLSPVKYGSLMMGVYFAATGLGGKVAGVVGEASESWGEYTTFIGITGFTVIFSVLVLLILKPLKRLTHGAEDIQIKEEHPDDHDIALEA